MGLMARKDELFLRQEHVNTLTEVKGLSQKEIVKKKDYHLGVKDNFFKSILHFSILMQLSFITRVSL